MGGRGGGGEEEEEEEANIRREKVVESRDRLFSAWFTLLLSVK